MFIRTGQKQTQFQKYYQKGHRKLENSYHDEALDNFNKARKSFDPKQDEFYRLIDLLLDESRIYKTRGEYTRALDKIRICEEETKKKYRNKNINETEQYIECLECEVKIFSESSQIMIAELEDDVGHPKFVENINKCVENYAKVIEIVASVLSNQNLRAKLYHSDIKVWQRSYAETIISSIDPLLFQAEKSNNKKPIFHLIYQVAEKVVRFYQLSCKSDPIKRQHSRTMFYRGAILLKTSTKYSEIESFLIKDYEFCYKNNFKDDLAKTKQQLFRYYVQVQNLEQARKYLDTDEGKKIFSTQFVRDMDRVKRLQSQIRSQQFQALNPERQLAKIQQIFDLLSYQEYNWWPRFISIGRKILPYIKSRELNFFICYHMAQSYFKIFDELNALHFCGQALKYCQLKSQDHFDILFLMLKIYENQNRTEKLGEIEKELNSIPQFKNKQVLVQHIKAREIQQKKLKFLTERLLFSEKENKMFQFLEKLEQERREQQICSEGEPEDVGQKENSNPFKATFMRSKQDLAHSIKKPRKQVLQQLYQQLCREHGVQIRASILNEIKNMIKQEMFIKIDLKQYFDLSNSQLQIYLELIRNEEWDLRNFALKKSFVQKFVQKIPFHEIKILKMCPSDKSIPDEIFQKLITRLTLAEQLHLEKLDRRLSALLNNTLIPRFSTQLQNLRVIKLKNCRITDQNLVNFGLIGLEVSQLDLAGNQIMGRRLDELNKMRHLENLNLSYNPLQVFNSLQNPGLRKLKLKCLKKYRFSQVVELAQIKFVQILDISENGGQVLEHLMRSNREYLLKEQLLELPNLQELRVKKSNISQIFLALLNQFMSFCSGFQNLDMRFCNYDKTKLENFVKYLAKCGKHVNVDARAHLSCPYQQPV